MEGTTSFSKSFTKMWETSQGAHNKIFQDEFDIKTELQELYSL